MDLVQILETFGFLTIDIMCIGIDLPEQSYTNQNHAKMSKVGVLTYVVDTSSTIQHV